MLRCGPWRGRSGVPPLITPLELSTRLAMVFSFTVSQIMSTLIASAGAACAHFNTWLPAFFPFLLSLYSLRTQSPFPPPSFGLSLMKVWFLLPESLSGWIKSQLALVNHLGSFLRIGETFYLRLNFPPVLTWHGIYSYIESVITSTSEIPHSLLLHYYGTFVRQPIAVSAPNWFILASVGMKWSAGRSEAGTTLEDSVAELPVVRRDFQTELNTDTMGYSLFLFVCMFILFLCSMFKITYIDKASTKLDYFLKCWVSLPFLCYAVT